MWRLIPVFEKQSQKFLMIALMAGRLGVDSLPRNFEAKVFDLVGCKFLLAHIGAQADFFESCQYAWSEYALSDAQT